jgi:hypothetical protein
MNSLCFKICPRVAVKIIIAGPIIKPITPNIAIDVNTAVIINNGFPLVPFNTIFGKNTKFCQRINNSQITATTKARTGLIENKNIIGKAYPNSVGVIGKNPIKKVKIPVKKRYGTPKIHITNITATAFNKPHVKLA